MNIVIIGAGAGGTSILKSLNGIEGIRINMIIDKNLDAPGIQLAKKLRIKYSQSIDDINTNNTDVIIEVTGNGKVEEIVVNKFRSECTIINSKAAKLFMTLVKKDEESLEKINKQVSSINDASLVIQDQLKDIAVSVEDIHSVSESLLSSTKISNEYIENSDKIIKYVNEISRQTKILGINASIESARAGEEGRGFAVVAKEVQKLANDSASFAEKISDMLTRLSVEIKKINDQVNKLEQFSEKQINASNNVNSAVNKLVQESNI